MFSAIFWLLALLLSVALLIEKNMKTSILFFGLFGTISSGAYLFMGAPDVSFASLALGAGFTTFVFLIAIKKTGTVRVKYIPTPYMVFGKKEALSGFEFELLKSFLIEQNLEAVYSVLDSREINRKQTDIIIGGIFSTERMSIEERKWLRVEILETKVFRDAKSREIDLVRMKKEILEGKTPPDEFEFIRDAQYYFLIEHHRPELAEDLRQFLKELKTSGEFQEMVRRYIG